jgi:hypothetical protein
MGHFLLPLVVYAVRVFQPARVLLGHPVWGPCFAIHKLSGLNLGCVLVQRVRPWRLLVGSQISSFNFSFHVKRLK